MALTTLRLNNKIAEPCNNSVDKPLIGEHHNFMSPEQTVRVHVQHIPEERKDVMMRVTVLSDEETRQHLLSEREMIREQLSRTA